MYYGMGQGKQVTDPPGAGDACKISVFINYIELFIRFAGQVIVFEAVKGGGDFANEIVCYFT